MHDILERKGLSTETTPHDVRWGRNFDGKFVWVFLIPGVSKPGVITWARAYESFGELGMDVGRGEVLELPEAEVQERLDKTTPVWPIANVHIPGYDRNEMMATHMSNHIVIGYGDILEELIATCRHLGIKTRIAGDAGKALAKK